jgi:hypothetical protein
MGVVKKIHLLDTGATPAHFPLFIPVALFILTASAVTRGFATNPARVTRFSNTVHIY